MGTKLLDIQPRELKFMFELKKQSSCAVQLINTSDQIVAFKVKTTSPKKYCVRPTTGIIKPKSKCDFTVTMQPQRSAPSDMQCKDKFLIQSTAVPFGTTEEEITPGMFAKDSGKHIEEIKLRVVLISPPNSPVLLAINGVMKQEPSYETSVQKDKQLSGVENLPSPVLAKDVEDVQSVPVMEELKCGKDVELRLANDMELIPSKDVEPKPVKDMEEKKLKLAKEMEELKSKLHILETKLSEAEVTIVRLTKETSTNTREKETLKRELALVRRKNGARKVQIGFPLLFVCAVMLISLAVGYLLHP